MIDLLLEHLKHSNIIDKGATICKLDKGGSGASLFEINSVCGDFILKNYDTVAMQKLGIREYNFYTASSNLDFKYLPEVIHAEKHKTLGILILLKKYRDIAIAEWDLPRQLSAADIIAQVHSKSDVFINKMNMNNEPFIPPATDALEKAYADWACIMDKHNINKSTFEHITQNFNFIMDFIQAHRDCFIHGDFYPNNCLLDDNNEMILVDWQNCELGSMAEVSFFISIGYDWGIDIHEKAIKKHYCERFSFYTGRTIPIVNLDIECNMSTVFVTYLHWAGYLQDSAIGRVKSIYDKMITSYRWMLENNCI